MRVFAIGDLHLGHEMDKPMCIFGPSWQDHMQKIKYDWLKDVQEEDLVLIPGDISWAMRLSEASTDLEWLNALPGKKICIRGNHDFWWDRPGKLNRLYEQLYFLQNTAYIVGHVGICGTRGWALEKCEFEENERMIKRECQRLRLSLEAAMAQHVKEIWVMMHYPPCESDKFTSPFIELMKQYPVKKIIYGHLHDENSWQKAPIGYIEQMAFYLVSADYLGFKPLCLGSLPD